jgi:uncharacterized protein YdiU (UPF0061 family)
MRIAFDNSYAKDLSGAYVPVAPSRWPDPQLLLLNEALAAELGLDPGALRTPEGVAMLSGHDAPDGAQPIAQAYAGHQFGGFNPQLGDGRAYLVGEVLAPDGTRHDIQLKGSGRTPFARGGDGRAVLGPVLREYLVSEAMHALGIPTTRALAACTTGDRVLRQNGLEPGAVLARTAASHLRVGTLQFFAARQDRDMLARVTDYAIARHDPDLAGSDGRYLEFLRRVGARQARLVARWMGVGFVHGVMNTDNCTLSGETIDYGPCAFMDRYDPATVFSSIDHGGRYAYGNQPGILLWNMARLAEALLPLIDPDEDRAIALATQAVEAMEDRYRTEWLAVFARKLGFDGPAPEGLIDDMHELWAGQGVDFTLFFRRLPDAVAGNPGPLKALFADPAHVDDWLARLVQGLHDRDKACAQMRVVNPVYIPRNHLVEHALDAASMQGDMDPFLSLLQHVQAPFTERDGSDTYAQPAPDDAPKVVTFCGT